jgi:diketogulonate reductase-like aldo/keto reductase
MTRMTEISKFTPIGLGTWMMENNPESSVRSLQAGLDAGANHIDTAEMYGSGRVEEIVGEALHGIRDKAYLVSKVLPSNAGYDTTIKACERSLKRLRTSYLDIYLLHWRDGRTPLEDTIRAFEKLKSDGKIRAWGVSNFDVDDMKEIVRLAGPGKVVCNQVYCSLQERAVEYALLPWCRDNGVALVAYSPLSQGRIKDTSGVLQKVAEELNVTPSQAALAFLIRNRDVIAIPKSSDLNRIRENVRSLKIQLSPDQIQRLDRAFPIRPRQSLPMI